MIDTPAHTSRFSEFLTFCVAIAACFSLLSSAAEPLVSLDFETNLVNTGTLGGWAQSHTYAPGEEPLFGLGPFGCCLDLTAASRHGGTTPQDPPSGGAALFRAPALDALDSFTIILWARQNPLTPGTAPARLLHKVGAWDLLPLPGGLTLSLGPDTTKGPYVFSGKAHHDLTSGWRFFAVTVSPQSVAAYTGGRSNAFQSLGSLPRHDAFASSAGEVAFGNFGGIRPFNGWLDRVRIFNGALDEAALRVLYAADLVDAKNVELPLVSELAGRSTHDSRLTTHASQLTTHDSRLTTPVSHPFRLPPAAIPFSTRWQRTNAIEVAQSFHASHLLWVYGSETGFISQAKAAGLFYQGTLNGLQGQSHSTTNRSAVGDASGRHENLDGNKNIPAWMVTFGPRFFTGCCNHPAFRKLFFADAKRLVDAGVDSIHVDDWAMNASWVRHAGVCFCDACRSGFREWLAERHTTEKLMALGIEDVAAFDYREHLKAHGVPDDTTYRKKFRNLPLTDDFVDFQIQSMRLFFKAFRANLDAWSPGKYIPVSVNGLLTPLRPDSVLYGVDVVDFFHGESSQSATYQTAREYIFGGKIAEAAGITQVISPIPLSTARTRAAIATTYALGQPHLVPWDLYMGSDATGIQPRYFGTREQYGDLYDFIHEHGALLDGSAATAEIGLLINGDEPGTYSDICLKLAARQLPFRILLGASRYARIPLRADALRGLRLVIESSPAAGFCTEDQAVLTAARASGVIRFVPATTDIAALSRTMSLDLLRIEGPESVYAFVCADPTAHATVIHLVNWNLGGNDTERAETYRHVSVALLQPARWGAATNVVWLAPSEHPVQLIPERHADCIRLTLPQLTTWGILKIVGGEK